MLRRSLGLFALCASLVTGPATLGADAPTTRPATLFNPARHMRVAEVKPGQKGYVRTVVSGTKIDQFDVEVVSILRNQFGPGRDVVLIRCKGDFMEHVGSVAGMSGSPVYLVDDAGNARMIGAYAYGWDLQKDPLAGVQPIEYMTQLVPSALPAEIVGAGESKGLQTRARWSLLDAGVVPAFDRFAKERPLGVSTLTPRAATDASGLRPLAIPLAASGLTPRAAELLNQLALPAGLKPLVAPGSAPDPAAPATKIEPGSVLVASLISGDLDMTGLGTCTDVIGDRVLAFGHPMFGDGSASVPFGGGSVNLIVPMLTASFKVGAGGPLQGTLDRDSEVGIAGTIGSKAITFPVTVNVRTAQGETRVYHFQSAIHSQMTPMLTAVATFNCVTAGGELPEENTLTYGYTMRFANGRELHAAGQIPSTVGTPVDFAREMMGPLTLALANPFERVLPTSVEVNLEVTPGVNQSEVVTAAADRTKYEPGDKVRLDVELRRYHGEKEIRPITFDLPADLKPGDYSLQLLDAGANLRADAAANPQKLLIENANELFDALQSVTLNSAKPKLFLRLSREPEGLSIGRTALQRLPGSRRIVYAQLGRADVQPVAESIITEVPADGFVVADIQVPIKVAKKK
ncbi:MAG: hypothetical protein QM770_17865 [Tepidisphaeraceae bacterium]